MTLKSITGSPRIYLAGQTNFGNRGCEALVRGTVTVLDELFESYEVMIPSFDPSADSRQWKGPCKARLRFVAPLTLPGTVKWWNRAVTRFPAIADIWEPRLELPEPVRSDVEACDLVLMIGGDNLSLDYGLGSLFLWSGLADAARRMGKPTILCAASVGPFAKLPAIERIMRRHLENYAAITVRESHTSTYLASIGVTGAIPAVDLAFAMEPQVCSLPELVTATSDGVLGFNMSPLIQSFRDRHGAGIDIAAESAAFVERILAETSLRVLLIPHVDPLDGSELNSDSAFMQRILDLVGESGGRLALASRGLNAGQTKYLISRCRFFIGARTHSTIAAWSTLVPTVSIAYSVKARGLNQDLLGSQDLLLETPQVDRATLWRALGRLREREGEVRALLARQIPDWKKRTRVTGMHIAKSAA